MTEKQKEDLLMSMSKSIDLIVQKMDQNYKDLNNRIDTVRTELKAEISNNIDSLRTELKAEISNNTDSLRTELKAEISAVRNELKSDINNLTREVFGLNEKVNICFEQLDRQIQLLRKDINELNKKIERLFIESKVHSKKLEVHDEQFRSINRTLEMLEEKNCKLESMA